MANNLNDIINEELFLFEVFNNKMETEYLEGNIVNGKEYVFKTNSGIEYLLHFFYRMLDSNDLIGEKKLSDIVDEKYFKYGRIGCVIIGYTIGSWNGDPEQYSANTNQNEAFELMSRIAFLVDIFKSKHPNNNIYIVGNEKGDERRLKLYELIYKNIFSDGYNIFKGQYANYINYVMFFISKTILK